MISDERLKIISIERTNQGKGMTAFYGDRGMVDDIIDNNVLTRWDTALNIVINKPHAVDKRIAGQQNIATFKHRLPQGCDLHIFDSLDTEVIGHGESEDIKNGIVKILDNQVSKNRVEATIIVQKLISKKGDSHSYHIVIRNGTVAQFHPVSARDNGPYRLTLCHSKENWAAAGAGVPFNDKLNVKIETSERCGAAQCQWIRHRLVPRMVTWAHNESSNGGSNVESVRLVGVEQYCQEYNRLKMKYASNIISSWTESSDPEKFVHEDIGIAAYILLLWRQQRKDEEWSDEQRQTFVDLGCGNGLLVYILTMEGHSGVGYDIRRRNIWSWYPDNVQLKELTIVPSLDMVLPQVRVHENAHGVTSHDGPTAGCHWLLGNHSDELTPWIPVLATISGPKTCFWVLPCCPFSFNAKYQRRSSNKSVFRDYLDWVREVCVKTGFEVEEDRMKIPSTKRVCFVGKRKANVDRSVLEALVFESQKFIPRQKVEKVRNCTQLERNLTETIVGKVVNWCLEKENVEEVNSKPWNAGQSMGLSTIAQRLQNENVELAKLKQECGGLQTLFRNHHYIFVVEKGRVRLRIPSVDVRKGSKDASKERLKTKPCWHFHNHPDGCPLSAESCQWIH